MTNFRIHIDFKKPMYKSLAALTTDQRSISHLVRLAVKEFIDRQPKNNVAYSNPDYPNAGAFMPKISETPEKLRQPEIKQSKGKGEASGKGSHYTQMGETSGMHGKATGGHPDIRAAEMKGAGKGFATKEAGYKNKKNG